MARQSMTAERILVEVRNKEAISILEEIEPVTGSEVAKCLRLIQFPLEFTR